MIGNLMKIGPEEEQTITGLTPEGEEVDNNGCGKDTQQPDGEVITNHHPLDYWVDHTTGTIIVDKNMEQRVWWADTDWNPELVLEDILSLVEEE